MERRFRKFIMFSHHILTLVVKPLVVQPNLREVNQVKQRMIALDSDLTGHVTFKVVTYLIA